MSELANIEAEQAVLGAIMLNTDALLTTTDIIQPDDFLRGAHREIYNACLDLYHLGEAVDIINLPERLRSRGSLERAGGVSYIMHLADATPTSANVKLHARIIRQKALLRRFASWATTMHAEAQAADDVQDLLNKAELGIIELAGTIAEPRDPAVNAILASVHQRWRDEQAGKKAYIETDYKLQQFVPRLVPGHLIVCGGYTSVGKSTFLVQIVADACEEHDARVMIFSLEDSREEKLIKLMANIMNTSQRQLMLGEIDHMRDRINKASEDLWQWKLQIYDDVYTVEAMRMKIKKQKIQQGIDIVCIDYIQNIAGEGSLYERISKAITQLQTMAKELQVTIIVVSQVSNEAMRANSEIIGLKGAGELAAAADIVLWLQRVKGKDKEAFLDCAVRKNRPFGATGVIPLVFNEKWSRIQKRGL